MWKYKVIRFIGDWWAIMLIILAMGLVATLVYYVDGTLIPEWLSDEDKLVKDLTVSQLVTLMYLGIFANSLFSRSVK